MTSFFIRGFYHSGTPKRRRAAVSAPSVYNRSFCGTRPPYLKPAIVRVFRGLPNAESRAPCALTIGNFDGVHRGHQAMLAHVRAAAELAACPSA